MISTLDPAPREQVVNFITARLADHPAPDLLDRYLEYGANYETHANVACPPGWERNEFNGFTDGIDTIWNVRIPKDSATTPMWKDYRMRWPLCEHVNAIGSSGWDWEALVSRWVGFDMDTILGHAEGVGIPDERLAEIEEKLQPLGYVEIRTSTGGGKGRHLWVEVNAIPAANHTEHAHTARRVLAKISHDIGEDITADVDACGGIMWIWRKGMPEDGQTQIKAANFSLNAADLPDLPKPEPAPARNGDKWDELARAFPTVKFDDKHHDIMEAVRGTGFPCDYIADRNMAHVHTAGLAEIINDPATRKELQLRGTFKSSSDGTDKNKANAFMYPLPDGGFKVFRFHDNAREHKSWEHVEGKKTRTTFNVEPPPTIKITSDLHKAVGECINALANDPNTFQRGGVLVELREESKPPKESLYEPGAPVFREISKAQTKVKLSRCARLEKYNGTQKKDVHVIAPDDLVAGIVSAINFDPVPTVTGLYHSPVLRPDGSINSTPGYDRATGLYLRLDEKYPPPMCKEEAIELLDYVVCDFPFESKAHKSAWYSLVITMLTQPTFPGCSPLHFVDANNSGVGKGLLTNTATLIAEGHTASRTPVPKEGDVEMRKLITASVLEGRPYILFDNLDHKLGGSAIELALTAERWSDRILGRSEKVDLPLKITWIATANNGTLSPDMTRRSVCIRLNSTLEYPAKRIGFEQANLAQYILDNRPALTMAALSIPRAYILAGRPTVEREAFGSFEGWDSLVRSSIIWAGLTDPDTRTEISWEMDEETVLLRSLIEAWEEVGSSTVSKAVELAYNGGAPLLKELIADFDGDGKNQVGQVLKKFRGRNVGGKRIAGSKTKPIQWSIQTIEEVEQ